MRPCAHTALALGVVGASVATGCSVRFSWPRHALDVDLHVSHERMVDAPVALDALTMVVDSVELVACPDADAPEPERSYDDPLGRLAALFVPYAYAHGKPGPTRLATPVVFDALAANAASTPLGQMTPPPGTYCEVVVGFGPADDDAVGLDASPDMLDTTLRACGLSMADDQTFDWSTSKRAVATVTLDTPLTFGSEHDAHAALSIDLPVDSALLDALATGGTDGVLLHARTHLRAHAELSE